MKVTLDTTKLAKTDSEWFRQYWHTFEHPEDGVYEAYYDKKGDFRINMHSKVNKGIIGVYNLKHCTIHLREKPELDKEYEDLLV